MKRPVLNADHINVAILITLILIIFGIALGYGCKTACIPEIVYQDVDRPQPCVVQIGALEELSLPPYPPFDTSNPKEWALQVEQIAKQREALLKARVEALNYQITEHNRLEPKCAQ